MTPQRIEALKKSDPVFAKRYKQLCTAKVTNKAPKFDLNDYYAPMTIPKGSKSLIRKKEEIIQVSQKVEINKPKIFKIEMEKVDAKVKHYMQNLCEFLWSKTCFCAFFIFQVYNIKKKVFTVYAFTFWND